MSTDNNLVHLIFTSKHDSDNLHWEIKQELFFYLIEKSYIPCNLVTTN